MLVQMFVTLCILTNPNNVFCVPQHSPPALSRFSSVEACENFAKSHLGAIRDPQSEMVAEVGSIRLQIRCLN